MSVRVALDTSFIIGLTDNQDVWYAQAQQLRPMLDTADVQIHVFDCVLAEVVSALARRFHERRRTGQLSDRLTQLTAQFPTSALVWVYPDLPKLYDDVIALVDQTGGELNFNDALIALACQQRGIGLLASFDGDFDNLPWLKRISQPTDLP